MIFSEVKIFQPDSFEDYRGELYTLFKQEEHELVFNHDKVSVSKQNVLRGLHGDSKAWKLITCLAGEIYLAIVDNRPSSDTYLTWDSIILTGKNRKQVLVPPMFANGHLVLSSEATFFYKWSYPGEYPDVKDQFSLNWRDPKINIYWPIDNPILSKRDKNSH
jgi:dTDP-4-dehydrorhamnose 3,5-epimerase